MAENNVHVGLRQDVTGILTRAAARMKGVQAPIWQNLRVFCAALENCHLLGESDFYACSAALRCFGKSATLSSNFLT